MQGGIHLYPFFVCVCKTEGSDFYVGFWAASLQDFWAHAFSLDFWLVACNINQSQGLWSSDLDVTFHPIA